MRKIYLIIYVLSVLFSCKSNNCKQFCSEKGLDQNCCPKIDSSLISIVQPNIKEINIFLETSASMQGYMPRSNPATEFQTIIPDIISKLDENFKGKVKFYSVFKSNTPFTKMRLNEARENILKGGFNWSGSTYIPAMIDSITKSYLKKSTINILLSDFIYSPEDKNSKIVQLAATDIRAVSNSLTSYSTTFICLFSEYRSTVCSNKMSTTKSPYYAFLQGNPENIRIIEKLFHESIKNSNIKYNELNFGLKYNRPFYSVFPYTETTSNFIANSCAPIQDSYLSIQDISQDSGGNNIIEFWLGLDLGGFPEYSRDSVYLKNNLKCKIGNGVAKIVKIEFIPYSNVHKDDIPIAQKCSHIVKFRVSGLSECVSILSLSLKFTMPTWKNTLNENLDENNRERTFGLEKIISGFEQAYCSEDSAYFFKNLQISLIKE